MARKFVSGVLAFAMVFGATAPVVFAEPVATEIVDQEANYIPTVENVSVKKDESVTVAVNGLPATAIIDGSISTSTKIAVTFNPGKQTVTVKNVSLAKDEKEEVTLQFKNATSDYFAPVKFTVTGVDASATYDTVEIAASGNVTTTIGVAHKISVAAINSTSSTVTPTKVKELQVRAETGSNEYFDVTVEDKTNSDGKVVGQNVVITPKKATPKDTAYKVQVNARLNESSAIVTKTYNVTVEASKLTSVTLNATSTSMTSNGSVTLIPQAYTKDVFGGFSQVQDISKAGLKWLVNGKDVTADITNGLGYDLKNTLDATKKVNFKADTTTGVVTMTGSGYVGSVRVTLTDATGDLSSSKTITITNDVGLKTGTDPWLYTSDSDMGKYDNKVAKAAKAGGTVDLKNVKFATWGTDDKAYPVANFGGVATLEVKDVVVKGTSYGADVAKKIVTIKDGVVTIADASNSIMAELLQTAGDKDIVISLTGKVKFSATDTREMWKDNSITITVTKASDKYNETIFTIAGKAFDGIPVMTVGDTVKVDAKVVDINKFTDGLDQRVIWSIRNAKDDNNVYATVDANGTVTALKKCLGTAELVAVPVANTNIEYSWKLYIMDSTATAAPTVTPAPTATTAPTAAPTTAPATKTGKVTASSLRVRETPVNGTVVGKLAKGTAVTILETKDGWYKVTAGSLTGWVSGEYVELTTPSTSETATTTANLKLRKTPKTGAVITTMKKGSKVEVLEKGSEWSKVKYNGKTGYASNAYLEFEEDAVG